MWIKSAGETARKVLLSFIWNLQLIEINLSQIRISGSKSEKVCAVCPYLFFTPAEFAPRSLPANGRSSLSRDIAVKCHQHKFVANIWANIINDCSIGPYLLLPHLTEAVYTVFLRDVLPRLFEHIPLLVYRCTRGISKLMHRLAVPRIWWRNTSD